MNWFLFWLFLHILAAVVAFGPIFVFPIVGTLVAKMPQHMRFAIELNHRIELRLVLPLAASMLISGSGLIWTSNINFFQSTSLIVAVAFYLLALTIAITVLLPATSQLVHFAEHAPTGGVPASGPPPEVVTLVRRTQVFGGLLMVLFLAIISLMIIQPGGVVFRS